MPILTTGARCFLEVAEVGSIRKAAVHLNLSASAVNRQILNFEDELGVRLLERLPRGVRLTGVGTMVWEKLCQCRDQIDSLHTELENLRVGERIEITIGIMDCLVGSTFADLLAAITERNPRIKINIRVYFLAEDLVRKLKSREIDLMVAFAQNISDDDIWKIHSITTRVGVIVPPGHRLAGRGAIPVEACYPETMLLPERSMTLGRLVRSALPERLRIAPLRTNSMRLIRETIKHNRGISFMNEVDVWNDVHAATLVFVPLADMDLSTELNFFVRDPKSVSEPVRTVAASLHDLITAELVRLYR
ncbi:LysR family transcriptional regulator [Gluconacetobacter sp. 1b LMG 1731]|uniref:LysR family transcriptional regulator n=1 Tax=Gluconacetobacter dulcium TaxID=2729096 RepID=A0A7W4IP75_9PROT|nr:LysR family transcriptional regulator [Gluconacetobacter dulcium]MBB2166447.1 LysR family transcriptional regulator [Gluconacetobacter dulcium]MBB2195618.1 LysR family transcriptional regulator [Gluconacetobacter dulcium]